MGGGGEGVGEKVRIHGLRSVSPCTVVVWLALSQVLLALIFFPVRMLTKGHPHSFIKLVNVQ